MGKMYRTSKGQMVDMDALRIANDKSPAVGNMGVNGRGDRLARGGKVTETVAQQTRAYYKSTAKASKAVSIKEDIVDVKELEEIKENMPTEKPKPKVKVKTIAKAKEVELEDGSIQIIEGDDSEISPT